MLKSKYDHYYLYSTLISAFIVVTILISCSLNSFLSYFLPQFVLCTIIFLSIDMYFILIKSKKTIPLKEWYQSFVNNHKDEFAPYIKEANKAVHKFILLRISVLQIYMTSMILVLCTFFVELDFAYEITDILLVALQYYAYITLLLFGFIFAKCYGTLCF